MAGEVSSERGSTSSPCLKAGDSALVEETPLLQLYTYLQGLRPFWKNLVS